MTRIVLPETEPIINVLQEDATRSLAYANDYMAFCRALPYPRDLVSLHKAKLGRQTTTTFTSEQRLWVWVRPTWTVFLGNIKGICFEVPLSMKGRTAPEKAWEAWLEYKQAMGVPEKENGV
jgi:hypothetical protein